MNNNNNYIVLNNQVISNIALVKSLVFSFEKLKHEHYEDALYTLYVNFVDEDGGKRKKIMNKDVMSQNACKRLIENYMEEIQSQLIEKKCLY